MLSALTNSTSNTTPLISVIIATYNRSRVLSYAIRSVLQSSYTNWELIVVGDCCTDDTEQVVRSFEDSRISFVNLPTNSGQQATPNNHGLKMARGEYIAFLNHDDLYLPDHLIKCLEAIEKFDCEMVFCPYINILPATDNELDNDVFNCEIKGYHRGGIYAPGEFQVASSWFLKREVAEKVGPWKSEKNLHVTPSQEWLFRAVQMKTNINFMDKISLITFFAGFRKGSYLDVDPYEYQFFFKRLKDPMFLARLIEKAGLYSYGELRHEKYQSPLKHLAFAFLIPVFSVLRKLGIHPHALTQMLKHGRKGGVIRFHNRYIRAEKKKTKK